MIQKKRPIGCYLYYGNYSLWLLRFLRVQVQASMPLRIDNIFEKDAPVLGGEVGSTSFNSGNIFPSTYDNLGRMYKAGVKFVSVVRTTLG